MPPVLTKNAVASNLVTLGIGSFVSGMLLMLALSGYFRGEPVYMYLYVFLILPSFILSFVVNARRILKAIT